MEDQSTTIKHNIHSFEIVSTPNSAVVIKVCRMCGLSYMLKIDSYNHLGTWIAIPHQNGYIQGNNKALEDCNFAVTHWE